MQKLIANKKMWFRIALAVMALALVFLGSVWQNGALKVQAQVQVLLVSRTAIAFNDVFPGESPAENYTVQLDTSASSAIYVTTLDPLPGLQNLCPFLNLANIDSPTEPDTLNNATLNRPGDVIDKWQVQLTVPGLKGQLSQDHNGGIIISGGDFGCKITITTTNIPVTFHFVKVFCPHYSDIAGNTDAGNYDATGGNFNKFNNYVSSSPNFPNPYLYKPVSSAEIPPQCTRIPGWQFKLSTDINQTQNVTTNVTTGSDGTTDINFSDLSPGQQSALQSGGELWVSEIQQPNVASFGALRCYNDAVNGDNLEVIQQSSSNPLPTNVYCLAYNVPKISTPQITVHGYKVICKKETDLPNWGTPTTAGRPAQMTQAVINKFVVDSKGECSFVKDWQFQYASPGANPKPGNFIGQAQSPWQNFRSLTGDSSSTPAVLNIASTSSAPSFLWVREVLKSGYIAFTDGSGIDVHPKNKSAELFCNVDGLNYDNYDRIDGPLLPGNTYVCVAFNVKGKNDKDDEKNNDYKHDHKQYSDMADYKNGIKNNNYNK